MLPADDAPPAGYEIVPTAEAKSLVAYLLSLKKGYHLNRTKPASRTCRLPPRAKP